MTGREIAEHLERIATAARNNDPEGLQVGRAMLGITEPHNLLNAITGAAILVATAFRLRDEDALTVALRRLANDVDALEEVTKEPAP